MFQWPSTRIPQGGVYHPPKVQYNPETAKFLKGLIQESRFTNQLRDKSTYRLRSDEPLPHQSKNSRRSKREPPILIRLGSSKRRSREAIVDSGVYERERFVPCVRKIDRDMVKKKLQNIMAYGKEIEPVPPKPKKVDVESREFNRYDEITKEIKEREDWLEEMEKLGEGHKYRTLIKQQIEAKLREMEKLKVVDTPTISTQNSARPKEKNKK